jgi:hypothetical protein
MAICRTCTIILLAALAAAAATAEDVRCPASIATTQSLSGAVPGWTDKKNTSPNVLAGLTFYDGPPEEQASLAPDEKDVKGKLVESWELFPNPPRQNWLVCIYSGTSITLARPLPKELRACTVTFDPQQTVDGYPLIERIACK